MEHIFISHVEEDAGLATEITGGLEGAGYRTWYYQRDTVPGASYLTQINQAIERAQAVVLIISPRSVDSKQVTKEVINAFEKDKPFLPVLREITHVEFQRRQPEWAHALAGSASIGIAPEGVSATIPRIVDGLKALGIQPGAVEVPVSMPEPDPPGYPPKHLADKIIAARSRIEGERKQVTVLFAEVTRLTSGSGALDPEEAQGIIRPCLEIFREEVYRYEGTIAQFIRNGVMALFGAPIAHEDAPQRALYAALSIQGRLQSYAGQLKGKGIGFELRIGVNTGLVVVGKIGDDLSMEYTAVGDTVDLAAEIEGLAEPGTIQVGESTYRLTRAYFEFKPPEKEPLKAYELIRASGVETRIGASIARGLTRFVGRERETQALKDAFDRAQSGAGQVVGIVGEAGVGKSRLLFELKNILPPGEYIFLEGPCLQYGGSMGYLPILDMLRSYLEIKEGYREVIVREKMEEKILGLDEKLASILPPLQELLSLKVDDEEFNRLEPKDKRERTFETIRNLLIRLSQDKPLVLAVEDLHWIDKTSEEFLDFLIGSLAANRILLILLYRPEYTHQWGSKSYYAQIGVDQLKLDHCAELVRSILEEGEVAPELRELILGRAAGNPLFMEELTHTLLENGSIERKEGRFVLSARVSEMQIPGTVQGIIAARMDRLEENIKRTMQVASVIGRDFAFRILHTITEMKEELKSYLNNLQRLEFIYEKSLFPELEYIFKHALTQEVAYNSLLIRRRKEIHEKIGRAIEELYPERLEEFYEMLAYHYSKGENWEKAYRYYKLSGEKEMGNYSNWEAYHFYQEAINALKQLPDIRENKMEQIKVCLLYAIPMELLGCPEDSLQTLEEGERLAKELGDERSLARFYMALSTYYTYRGDHLLGKKYSEDSFNEAKKLQDIELMAPAALAICFSCLITGQYLEILDIAPDVIALLEKTKREPDLFIVGFNVYSFLCAYCGFGMGFLGNFEEGEVFFQKGLTNAAKIDDIVSLGLCEVLFSYFWGNKGEGRLCIEHSQKGIKYLEEANWPYLLGIAWANRGSGYYLLGDLESAQKDMEKGLSLQTNSGVTLGLAMTYFALSITLLDSGDTKKAERYAIKALELSRERNEKPGEGLSLIVLGRIWGKAEPSKTDKARKSIEQGIRILEDFKLRPGISLGYSSLGELYADTGQKEQARENLRKALGMMEEMGIAYWPDRAREVLGRLE